MNVMSEISDNEFIKKNSGELIFRKVRMIIKPKNTYGITEPHIIRSNDNYELEEIFFSIENYVNDDKNFKINPYMIRPGNIICGFVKNTDKGPYYVKWFICNYKFLYLWTKAHCQAHPSLYDNINLNKK